jgi:DNA-binding response OmpR family regulator
MKSIASWTRRNASASESSCSTARHEISLRGGGVSVRLSRAEARLLEALARVPEKLARREDLHELLCGKPWDARSNAVDFHIHGLRRKLSSLGSPERLGVEIRTVHGDGYSLVITQPGQGGR